MNISEGSVAISGLGCISAAGRDVEEHLQTFVERSIVPAPVPGRLFETSLPYPVFAVGPDPLSPWSRALLENLQPKISLIELSRTSLLVLDAALQAIRSAGLNLDKLQKKRVGICLGTTVGCAFNDEEYYRTWRRGGRPCAAPIFRYLGGNIASVLQAILCLRGPVGVITNACASGTDAIGVAKNWLNTDRCDLVIAGGADALSRIAYNGFASLMLADPDACRPFDQSRKGLNLGEGAGIMVLAKIRQDDRPALGWVHGYGTAADAWHPTAPHPDGRGLQAAIKKAVADCGGGIKKEQVSLINAHGTGTPTNDLAETTAVAAVFSQDSLPPLVSTKGFTGHTLGAAGGLEAIFTLLALAAGESKGSFRCGNPDPTFPYQPMSQGVQVALNGKIGISESLAFGGSNSCLVLEAAS
ncbi:MAG: beta-ketoacyl-[acyl-carrier-protein] synthase family protein [Desulfobulbaceae bacterium]|nr:beta-ketoacyl-[acyl-carrier-protein] synthase family protein [Desulfobulbaceae bacterium]HIJ78970.1 beta-ketoacyl-[acyl-carrier-protein] synthase family protein [Deltaproteobacteria bacterium]